MALCCGSRIQHALEQGGKTIHVRTADTYFRYMADKSTKFGMRHP